ncbi:MAG: HipA domain-containing protein, partial [Alphaproteobacteria bacterium]|nr:HipA domain-containing protein [Alphaproteobacteria bacterium]
LQLQALSYLIANGDLHAKNISIQVAHGHTRLTPIYDLLSTLPYGDGDLAIQIEGRGKKLKRQHFLACGERIGIRPAATNRMLNSLLKGIAPSIARLNQIGLPPRKTTHLERTMRQRLADLGD